MANWLQFMWEVVEDGHSWIDVEETVAGGEKTNEPYITPGRFLYKVIASPGVTDDEREPLRPVVEAKKQMMIRQYKPLESYPDLYKTFAKVKLTKKGVLSFANKYGLLEHPNNLSAKTYTVPVTDKVGYAVHVESLSTWQSEILDMKHAVDLMEDIKREDMGTLEQRIVWRKDGAVKFKTFPGIVVPRDGRSHARKWIAFPKQPSSQEFYQHVKRGDTVKAAKHFLQVTANKKLSGRSDVMLLWDPNWDQLGMYHVPRDLLGAMWLQFSQELIDMETPKVCEECGKPMPGGRSHKKYCSDRCRKKASRARQQRDG